MAPSTNFPQLEYRVIPHNLLGTYIIFMEFCIHTRKKNASEEKLHVRTLSMRRACMQRKMIVFVTNLLFFVIIFPTVFYPDFRSYTLFFNPDCWYSSSLRNHIPYNILKVMTCKTSLGLVRNTDTAVGLSLFTGLQKSAQLSTPKFCGL